MWKKLSTKDRIMFVSKLVCLFQIVKRLLKKDDDSKLLALKMSGNLGYPELIDHIKEKIQDKLSPVKLRTEAVHSLTKMALTHPEKVIIILSIENTSLLILFELWYSYPSDGCK